MRFVSSFAIAAIVACSPQPDPSSPEETPASSEPSTEVYACVWDKQSSLRCADGIISTPSMKERECTSVGSIDECVLPESGSFFEAGCELYESFREVGVYDIGCSGIEDLAWVDAPVHFEYLSTYVGEHFTDLWMAAPDDLFVVGETGLIFRGNGQGWYNAGRPFPHERRLRSIWGSSANDVWAVGDSGLILHFDGTDWTFVNPGLITHLDEVTGSGPNDVWIACWDGVVAHFDGEVWSTSTLEGEPDLYAAWAFAPNDVWVGGAGGRIFHFDGETWTEHDSGTTEDLHSLFGVAPGSLWAGAGNGTITAFDGTSWTPSATLSTLPIKSISGTGPDDLRTATGAIQHFDGSAWRWINAGRGLVIDLASIDARYPNHVWTTGIYGDVRHCLDRSCLEIPYQKVR